MVDGRGVLDGEHVVGVLAGGLGVERALPGINEVLGRDGVAVGPLGVVPQVEDVILAAVGDLGAGGQRVSGFAGLIQAVEAFLRVLQHGERDGVGDLGDIRRGQFLRFGPVEFLLGGVLSGAVTPAGLRPTPGQCE